MPILIFSDEHRKILETCDVFQVEAPPLVLLLIEGLLVFEDADEPRSLDAKYIWVHGGRMEIGTERKPYEGRATVTLHGDRFRFEDGHIETGDVEIPHLGAKGLVVTPMRTYEFLGCCRTCTAFTGQAWEY